MYQMTSDTFFVKNEKLDFWEILICDIDSGGHSFRPVVIKEPIYVSYWKNKTNMSLENFEFLLWTETMLGI